MRNFIVNIKREVTGSYPDWLTELKTHLAADTSHGTELTNLLKDCIRVVENFCNISIVETRITLLADLFEEVELPYGPVVGLLSVKTRGDSEGSGIPEYDTMEEGWGIEGEDFLNFIGGLEARYKLIYTAGYSVIPEDLKLAVFNEVAYRFENKGDVGNICEAARTLALPFKRMQWI